MLTGPHQSFYLRFRFDAGTKFWALIILALVAVYIAIAAWANTDLADGRFSLFMDERITFDGVKQILHPDGWKSFWWAITDGNDQRYGRSLWNSLAVGSAIPEMIWGDKGQIIGARMTGAVMLAAAFLIMTFSFVARWPLRVLLLGTLAAMPFSDYFTTMPKPEPLQLLCLAIFFHLALKQGMRFGWHWIFLGLAFGTKISTLPVIAVSVAAAYFAYGQSERRSVWGRPGAHALMYFLLGFALAVPILLIPIVLAIGFLYLVAVMRRWELRNQFLIRLLYVVLGIIGIVTVLVTAQKPVNAWMTSTFLNTVHGQDQSSNDVLAWIEYVFNSWLSLPEWPFLHTGYSAEEFGFNALGWLKNVPGLSFITPKSLTLALIISAAVYVGLFFIRRSSHLGRGVGKHYGGVVILLCGTLLNVAIVVGVHRLWGHYLFPGGVLMAVGLAALADSSLKIAEGMRVDTGLLLERASAYFLAFVALVVIVGFWAPNSLAGYRALGSRTASAEYQQQYLSYIKYVTFLNEESIRTTKKLKVVVDPMLFPPPPSEAYQLIEFWGPYVGWDEHPDVILFGIAHTASGEPVTKDSPNFKDYVTEREGYSRLVIALGAQCAQEHCFQRWMSLPNGGEVLVLARTTRDR